MDIVGKAHSFVTTLVVRGRENLNRPRCVEQYEPWEKQNENSVFGLVRVFLVEGQGGTSGWHFCVGGSFSMQGVNFAILASVIVTLQAARRLNACRSRRHVTRKTNMLKLIFQFLTGIAGRTTAPTWPDSGASTSSPGLSIALVDASIASGRFDLSIRRGHIVRLVPKRPLLLCCRQGALLVTIQGDLADYQLADRDELSLPSNRVVLVEGEGTFFVGRKREEGESGNSSPWRPDLRTASKKLRMIVSGWFGSPDFVAKFQQNP